MTEPADDALARSATKTPDPALRNLVTTYHGYCYDPGGPSIHHGLPSTGLTVVLALERPIDVGWLGEAGSRRQSWTLASGLSMSCAAIYQSGRQHGITLDLTPLGARVLLGVPASELGRQLISLGDLIGAAAEAQLYDAVAGAHAWPARFAELDRWLLRCAAARAGRPARPEPTLRHAWERLHVTRGRLPITRLAADVGWSRRHLSQRFAAEFGIGPKQAARLVRFGWARDLVGSDHRPLAEVAATCGYADQAHLTREWRELVGLPPTTWLAEERPFLQDADHQA